MSNLQKPSAILLMGPTASGKTALGVALAQAMNAEIISVDSALVYKGMDIGTAKPTLAERGGVPHHLIDILDPSEAFSTGQFRNRALELMADITARGKLPLLVGGTMLYFSALTQGLAQLPEADPEIRQRLDDELQQMGKEVLHARLTQVDPQAAARIHVNDPQRIQRALEVYEISGRPLSSFFDADQHAEHPFRFTKLIVAPEQRSTLHAKIAERFDQMLAQGFLEEVQTLWRRGDLDESMPSIRCVGYRQAWSYLNGEYDLATMRDKAIIATRQLAKRQFTWLRKEQDAHHLITGCEGLLEQALAYCRTHE
ncbi:MULTISPECIES: tRNA (adenosine(37)-N6)-dimethylallyltransferase MiaA [Methylomonas]|uniref:tRNA dimethylallyltransferase n=2 Tax=Methylomonas TaxID=416 RepID=A0A126T7V5_9GAMM|nr:MULTISPECIES: tRNA (adenosine(37)-N6)-dimethylallyltransferase MiaA [Methylomonas]AMK78167.1 tRNA dimethylallyltransferase [Methylomonas denitrificans]OAI03890.1 tRNA dimethylallyltransferase [Methylomonas methanica]TCV87805.1 tRNA dimethylallyltransferase [Methylomonas methanica]